MMGLDPDPKAGLKKFSRDQVVLPVGKSRVGVEYQAGSERNDEFLKSNYSF